MDVEKLSQEKLNALIAKEFRIKLMIQMASFGPSSFPTGKELLIADHILKKEKEAVKIKDREDISFFTSIFRVAGEKVIWMGTCSDTETLHKNIGISPYGIVSFYKTSTTDQEYNPSNPDSDIISDGYHDNDDIMIAYAKYFLFDNPNEEMPVLLDSLRYFRGLIVEYTHRLHLT